MGPRASVHVGNKVLSEKSLEGKNIGSANFRGRGLGWAIENRIAPLPRERWQELFLQAMSDPLVEQGHLVPELHRIETAPPRSNIVPFPPATLKIFSWNAHGLSGFEGLLTLPKLRQADVILLGALDLGMARTGNVNLARRLAAHLGFHYAFVPEYLLDNLGSRREQRRFRGMGNDHGIVGKAILCRYPLHNIRAIRMPQMQAGQSGERRCVGSEVALLADVKTASGVMTVGAVDLASRSNPHFRKLQLGMVLEQLPPLHSCVLGGNWNTHTLDGTRMGSFASIPFQSLLDMDRFRSPQIYEPLFKHLLEKGFRFGHFNDARSSWNAPVLGMLAGARLDWFCGRNVHGSTATTLPMEKHRARPGSRHHPIWVECRTF